MATVDPVNPLVEPEDPDVLAAARQGDRDALAKLIEARDAVINAILP